LFDIFFLQISPKSTSVKICSAVLELLNTRKIRTDEWTDEWTLKSTPLVWERRKNEDIYQ
jgi:hypothetical protein